MTKRKPKNRSGYVLVMTLLLVGLCGAVLARLAQHGLSQALAASRAAAELQEEWARKSCRLALLPRVERLLESAAAATEHDKLGWPYPDSIKAQFRLGRAECAVVLADEQARPNLNLLHTERPEQTPMIASSPFRGTGSRPLNVRLSPSLVPPSTPSARYFDSWGQVYDLTRAGGDFRSLRVAASQLTCWGNRRLNVARASDQALELVASLALNGPEVRALVEARQGYSGDLHEMLAQVDVPGRKKARLRRLLTDRSSCFSMWLTMTDGRRASELLAIHETGRQDVPPITSFHFP